MRLRCEMPIFARTVWMFGFHRRRVRRCECETDMPKPGPLPQTSQTAATDTPEFNGVGAMRLGRRGQRIARLAPGRREQPGVNSGEEWSGLRDRTPPRRAA